MPSGVRKFATGTELFTRAGLLGPQLPGHRAGTACALTRRSGSDARRHRCGHRTAAAQATAVPSSGSVAWVRPGWMRGWSMRPRWRRSARCRCSGCSWSPWYSCCIAPGARLLAIVITLGLVVAIAIGTGGADRLGAHHRLLAGAAHRAGDRHRDPGVHPLPLHRPPSNEALGLHHARVLANKFLPSTASIFATAVGFAALSVSNIRPVREMGLWTASRPGGGVARELHPVSGTAAAAAHAHAVGGGGGRPLVSRLRGPVASAHPHPALAAGGHGDRGHGRRHHRPGGHPRAHPAAGAADRYPHLHRSARCSAAQDTRFFEAQNGLGVYQLWLKVPKAGRPGSAVPARRGSAGAGAGKRSAHHRRGRADFAAALGAVCAVRRRTRCPPHPQAWEELAGQLEQILLTTPGTRGFVDVNSLGNVRLTHPRPRPGLRRHWCHAPLHRNHLGARCSDSSRHWRG